MDLISIKNATVSFGDQVVLENICLDIRQGESFVILGPSGQGKTTLLKLMCGLISPQKGEVFFELKNYATLSARERRRIVKTMGILFQKNALFDSLTCIDNICFPLRETTMLNDWEITKIAESYLEVVGISHARDLYPDEISGGMQKRLGIARALALDPKIIFYDDPTAGLDPITSRKIIELILKLKEEKGSTIIAITNDMNRAYQMADRIGFVNDKSLLVTGSPAETRENSNPCVFQFIRGSTQGPLTSG